MPPGHKGATTEPAGPMDCRGDLEKPGQAFRDWGVVLGVDGMADFNALHSRRHDDEATKCNSMRSRS